MTIAEGEANEYYIPGDNEEDRDAQARSDAPK